MHGAREIAEKFDTTAVEEVYEGDFDIADLRKELDTRGHIFVIRGDRAYAEYLGNDNAFANPKFWMYENLINLPEIQDALKAYPQHKLFDGVGYSALEALGFHAKRIGRKVVAVMAREMLPAFDIFSRYDIEVIHGDGPMEEGYVRKQTEVLRERKDLIPLHQALNGAKALAPIGNRVVKHLEELSAAPDASLWCMASGSNLYGIGGKIKQRFADCETIVVEPETNVTVDNQLDISDTEKVKQFARKNLRDYSLKFWGKKYSGVFPLHAGFANRYLLILWEYTGKMGFDRAVKVPTPDILKTQRELRELNSDYNWSKTTALALKPAIDLARDGKNVVVMAYGRDTLHSYRDLKIV